MSSLKVQDRLQPALLDRLTDDDPGSTVEAPDKRVVSRTRLREVVLRDLSWLFNSARLSDSESFEGYPQALHSVINFGLPTLSGQTASSVDPVALQGEVRQAIIEHEPRILPETLRVERSSPTNSSTTTTRSASASAARCGPSRCRWNCCCTPTSIWKPAASTCANSRAEPMDPRLLRYYNQELQHLREMGAEFALAFPKIAARLRMDGIEVADPYVERLLEGVAFLAGRIQLKIDAEFPRFSQRLLEIVYPHFLAPTPSMLIAQLQPQLGDAGLASGALLPRGTMMAGAAQRADAAPCRFRTAHPLTMWPLEVVEASYFTHASNLPLASVPEWRKYGGGLRLKLRTTAGVDFSQLALQDLRLHCSGIEDTAFKLHELVCGHTLGAFVMAGGRNGSHRVLPGDCVRAVGYGEEEALLPPTLHGFDGYRLLQEYFAFPQRFLFFDLCDLGPALRELGGTEVELVLLFSRGDSALQQAVDASSLALNCVPAINLFEQRCDRIQVNSQTADFHVVVDRARPMDYEIFELLAVEGHGVGLDSERRFLPFYAAFHQEDHGHDAFYSLQREPRLMSSTQKRDGLRSSYIGTEVFMSVVDPREAPYPGSLQQLGVRALCSNRDLPLLMATGQPGGDLTLEGTAPVTSIRILKGPSRPLSALRDGNVAWKFINQLSLNHLSLLDTDAEHGAAALRELLRLYVHEGDSAHHRQIEGLRSVRTEPVVRRLMMPGPIAFGRGVRIELEVDELAFQGGSAFLMGSVLERYFARHVSMNGFTETRVRSQTRGEILIGRPTCGTRPIL